MAVTYVCFVRASPIPRILALCLSLVLSVPATAAWLTDTQGIMGTEISVTLWHDDEVQGRAVIEQVMAEMRRIDSTLSPYKPASDLSQLNAHAASAPQVLTDELILLIDKSLWFSELSDGAFDITFASLAQYYSYRDAQGPTADQRTEALPAINYKWLDFNKSAKTLRYTHKKVKIDLGGIAKGYAVDRAIHLLRAQGIKHASVSAGGDSALLGDRRGRPWIIGIKNPRQASSINEGTDAGDAVIRLPLENVAVSTSGDYERYFIDEQTGERIHHILNPKTGKSASQVMSVTVLGEQGINTDPLSTTVFVLGVEKGLALVNKLAGFDVIIIDIHGKVHYSNELIAGNP